MRDGYAERFDSSLSPQMQNNVDAKTPESTQNRNFGELKVLNSMKCSDHSLSESDSKIGTLGEVENKKGNAYRTYIL